MGYGIYGRCLIGSAPQQVSPVDLQRRRQVGDNLQPPDNSFHRGDLARLGRAIGPFLAITGQHRGYIVPRLAFRKTPMPIPDVPPEALREAQWATSIRNFALEPSEPTGSRTDGTDTRLSMRDDATQ